MDASQSTLERTNSLDHNSQSSHTAQDYIASQLRLEADAREALPYQFDTCTKPLGPLRQSVFACLTCSPPPASPHQQFTPAGVCYSCSISCHGEHNLVELFAKRDFVCDCGTTRLINSGTPCSLRLNVATGRKGGVSGEEARQGNKYNQNFQGSFCGCGEEYDPEKEKGTMFQCLGLGTIESGGCGEDWWHPECLMGLPRVKAEDRSKAETNGELETVKEDGTEDVEHSEEAPPPPGFPHEDDFDHLICYKCADAFPWIKQYAGTPGFLPAVFADSSTSTANGNATATSEPPQTLKRKADDEPEAMQESKKVKSEDHESTNTTSTTPPTNGHHPTTPKHTTLPLLPSASITLFLKEDFRSHLCHCPTCFPNLSPHPQLLEEEDTYEPPVSESADTDNDAQQDDTHSLTGRSVNSGSLLERGEAALSGMDRVKAIEGVMAYNHVRDKVKEFLQPFAESGQAVGAEDIKAYFAKLRGDEEALREAREVGAGGGGLGEGDGRREQGGY